MSRQQSLFVAGHYVSTQNFREVGHPFSEELKKHRMSFIDSQSPSSDLEILEAALESSDLTFQHLIENESFFPAKDRKLFLAKLVQKIRDSKDNLSRLITLETAKPIRLARAEIDRSIEYIASVISQLELTPTHSHYDPSFFVRGSLASRSVSVQRIPRGPLLAITPFNFPILLALHKIIPALAVGCPVILKSSPLTPLCAATLVDFCHSCELPAGMISHLVVSDELLVKIAQDPRVKQISFTGSTEVGWNFHSLVKKPIVLELGGAAPCYVSDSINNSEIQKFADWICSGALSFSGQACISTQSIFCAPSVYSNFKSALSESLKNFPVGSPLNEDTLMGPVVSSQSFKRLNTLAEQLKTQTQSHMQHDSDDALNLFLSPRVFELNNTESPYLRSEIFGPIRLLVKWENSFTDWIKWANSLDNRLQVQIMSRDNQEIELAKQRLHFGTLVSNAPSLRFDNLPFGGQGLAGLGYEGTQIALEQMNYFKTTTLF